METMKEVNVIETVQPMDYKKVNFEEIARICLDLSMTQQEEFLQVPKITKM